MEEDRKSNGRLKLVLPESISDNLFNIDGYILIIKVNKIPWKKPKIN